MAETTNKNNERLYQDLVDAKCSEQLTKECVVLAANDSPRTILTKLSNHRKDLLKGLHECQDAIDCLDCLMHEIRKVK